MRGRKGDNRGAWCDTQGCPLPGQLASCLRLSCLLSSNPITVPRGLREGATRTSLKLSILRPKLRPSYEVTKFVSSHTHNS